VLPSQFLISAVIVNEIRARDTQEREENICKVLTGNPEGNRLLGRPRHIWADTME
jgi:hypothetical protein